MTDQTAHQIVRARDSEASGPPDPPAGAGRPRESGLLVVTHNGREYLATEEMAEIFQRQAQRIVARGESELVVLAHAFGVDLLPITSITPFSVSALQPQSAIRGRGLDSRSQRGNRVGSRAATGTDTATATPVEAHQVPWPESGFPERTAMAMASVPLRIVGPGHRISTLQTLVVYIGDSTFEIHLDGRVIGYIRRAGNTFAALPGPEICPTATWGHWNLWDSAATFLVNAADSRPQQRQQPGSIHAAI